jgi:hypothetical protein
VAQPSPVGNVPLIDRNVEAGNSKVADKVYAMTSFPEQLQNTQFEGWDTAEALQAASSMSGSKKNSFLGLMSSGAVHDVVGIAIDKCQGTFEKTLDNVSDANDDQKCTPL